MLFSLAYAQPSFVVAKKLSVVDVTGVDPRTISLVNSKICSQGNYSSGSCIHCLQGFASTNLAGD
jgi:hypothetical protein